MAAKGQKQTLQSQPCDSTLFANGCVLQLNAEALQSILRILVVRGKLQLSAVIGDRLGALAELLVDLRPALKIIGSRLHRHRPLGIGQALRVLALPMIGPGAVAVGPGQSVGTVAWRLDYCGAARNSLIVRKGVARAPEPLLLRKRPGRQRDDRQCQSEQHPVHEFYLPYAGCANISCFCAT